MLQRRPLYSFVDTDSSRISIVHAQEQIRRAVALSRTEYANREKPLHHVFKFAQLTWRRHTRNWAVKFSPDFRVKAMLLSKPSDNVVANEGSLNGFKDRTKFKTIFYILFWTRSVRFRGFRDARYYLICGGK